MALKTLIISQKEKVWGLVVLWTTKYKVSKYPSKTNMRKSFNKAKSLSWSIWAQNQALSSKFITKLNSLTTWWLKSVLTCSKSFHLTSLWKPSLLHVSILSHISLSKLLLTFQLNQLTPWAAEQTTTLLVMTNTCQVFMLKFISSTENSSSKIWDQPTGKLLSLI